MYKAIGQFKTGEHAVMLGSVAYAIIIQSVPMHVHFFETGKSGGDDLFDKLDTSKLNAHLKELMPGLTAKVFRTYNASITLDEMVRCKLRMFSEKPNCLKFSWLYSSKTIDTAKEMDIWSSCQRT